MTLTDRLLYVLSERGKTPWAAFQRIVDDLAPSAPVELDHMPGSENLRRLVGRVLDHLGHADIVFDEDGRGVWVAPAALAALPAAGLHQAVLVGARVPSTLDALRAAAASLAVEVDEPEQASDLPLIPLRIAVSAEDDAPLHALAEALDLPYLAVPPARSILTFAAGLDDYLAQLPEPSFGTLADWSRKEFDPDRLRFREAAGELSGFTLCQYSDPTRGGRRSHALVENGHRTSVDRDWGRYAVLQRAGYRDVLLYDARRFVLAVPAGVPLPRLYARALALCSGLAPRFVRREALRVESRETWGFALYGSVPLDLAQAAAARLGQQLQKATLDLLRHD